jgi:hypothetical protein
MKLKTMLSILLVVGLFTGYGILLTDYRNLHQDNAALTSQIAAAGQQLALIPPAPSDLSLRLEAARAALEGEKDSFPAQLNSTRIVNDILNLGETTKVKTIPLSTRPWAAESANQTTYPVFRLSMALNGTFVHLSDFLDRLENSGSGTLVITNLKIDSVTGPPADEGETGDALDVSCDMDIAVYARPSLTGEMKEAESR